MHINIELRGYESEKALVEHARKELKYIVAELEETLIDKIIGWENLGENDEILEVSWKEHIYPDDPNEYNTLGVIPRTGTRMTKSHLESALTQELIKDIHRRWDELSVTSKEVILSIPGAVEYTRLMWKKYYLFDLVVELRTREQVGVE